MNTSPVSGSSPIFGSLGQSKRASTPEEAARQFEQVLIRQFVDTMTSGLFKSNLAGDEGPAWIESNADTQRDMLTDVLTQHLVDEGTFNISRLLLQQWNRADQAKASPAAPAPTPEAKTEGSRHD